MPVDSTSRREFVVIIHGEESGAVGDTRSSSNAERGNIWRESSYDFRMEKWVRMMTNDGRSFHFTWRRAQSNDLSDPHAMLMDNFLQKYNTSCGEISLDIELNMAELQRSTPPSGLIHIFELSSPLGGSSDEEGRNGNRNRDETEVVKWTSNKSILSRTRQNPDCSTSCLHHSCGESERRECERREVEGEEEIEEEKSGLI